MPLLSSGQAQKEITHNEALLLVDCLLHGCGNGAPTNSPPADPIEGVAYLCGPAATGEWSGRNGAIACWTMAGWRFITPVDGLELRDRSDGCKRVFLNGAWSHGLVEAKEVRVEGVKVIGARRPAIAPATGGATIDTQARAVLAEVLVALRAHGLIEA